MNDNKFDVNPINERLYKVTPSVYCGFLVKQDVMKKITKLSVKFEQEIRKVLTENIDDIYEYGWNMFENKTGEKSHTYLHFANNGNLESKLRRIELFKAKQPEYMETVYKGTGHCENSKYIIETLKESKQ